MGLTYGVVKHNGVPAANVTVDFYCAGVKKGSDQTDATGNYSLTLTGPAQYVAKVGATTCSPNPINVPVGPLACNLTY